MMLILGHLKKEDDCTVELNLDIFDISTHLKLWSFNFSSY